MSNPRFIDVSTPADIADALGAARATLNEAKSRVEFLESLLKETGETSIDGEDYHVAISYGVVTNRTDWKAVAAKLNPSRQLITAHTKASTSDRIRVSAHNK
jgi:hypothetical protein